jgi:hypothetical protein
MKFFDTILGRTKPAEADLDRLFRLTNAAIQLQATYGLRSSGQAGVCYKTMTGRSFAEAHVEFRQLLGLQDGDTTTTVHEENDTFGYTWIVIGEPDFERLVTLAHVVNSTLEEQGYGPSLLCSVFSFVAGAAGTLDALDEDAASVVGAPMGTWTSTTPVYLVYLFKQGTFYPFIPQANEHRDAQSELVLAETLKEDLVIEPDLERRFPIWGVPVR